MAAIGVPPGEGRAVVSPQDVTQSMCEAPDREAEADEKRKENKERGEREALRCA